MGSTTKFLHQKPMQKAPPLPANTRASDHDVRRMTGHSGPIHGSHTRHVHHTVEGDHRQDGLHSGHQNRSTPPKVQSGQRQNFPPMRNGGSDYGPDDAA